MTKAEQRAEMIEQILDAAEDLFSKHGLYGVTLKDVAQRVGVHHTLINYYFDDKKSCSTRCLHAGRRHERRRMEVLDDMTRRPGQAHGGRRAARLPRHRPRPLHRGRRARKNYAALGAQVANTPEWGAD